MPDHKMPAVHVGQTVLYFNSDQKDARPCAAIVVATGDRTVDLWVLLGTQYYNGKPIGAVKHLGDPKKSDHDKANVGFWDHHQTTKDFLELKSAFEKLPRKAV